MHPTPRPSAMAKVSAFERDPDVSCGGPGNTLNAYR
jgi:hypothetical protein